jgi:hypothetical protein
MEPKRSDANLRRQFARGGGAGVDAGTNVVGIYISLRQARSSASGCHEKLTSTG